MFYIIPKFSLFLADFGSDLPLVTVVIFESANFCVEHWKILLGVTAAVVVAFLSWRRTEAGRILLDRIKLKIPVLGGIVHDYAQNRFTRTLATLQAGGIPLVPSLEISARAVGNALFDALGIQVYELPMTPEAVYMAIRKA